MAIHRRRQRAKVAQFTSLSALSYNCNAVLTLTYCCLYLRDDVVALAVATAKAKAAERELQNEVGLRHLDRINDGILDYETPGALCDLLRSTYGSLPTCRSVNLLSLSAKTHTLSPRPCVIDTGSHSLSSALLGEHILEGPYDVDAAYVILRIDFLLVIAYISI